MVDYYRFVKVLFYRSLMNEIALSNKMLFVFRYIS